MEDVEQPLATRPNSTPTRPDSTVVNPNITGLTTRKKAIYATVAVGIVGTAIVVIFIFVYFISGENNTVSLEQPHNKNNETGLKGPEVCQTVECVDAAKLIKDIMNESVSPCDDFYQFSCGNFKTHYKVPEGEKFDHHGLIRSQNHHTINRLLEAPDKQDQKPYVTKAKHFYKACTDVSRIDELGREPIMKLLEDVGGWPLVNDWKEENFDLKKLLHNGIIRGVETLIKVKFDTNVDSYGVTTDAIYVDKGIFDPKLKKKKKEPWKKYIYDVAKTIGVFNTSSVEKDIDDMVVFHSKLLSISKDEVSSSLLDSILTIFGVESKKLTLQQFSNENSIPDLLDMGALIKELMSESDVEILDNDQVINEAKQYFKKLKMVLPSIDKKTITNYIVWVIIYTFIEMFPAEFRKLPTEWKRIYYSEYKFINLSREWFCWTYAERVMPLATGRMYLDVAVPPQAKDQVNEMVDYIQNMFTDHLNGLTWMDEKTKKRAIEKNNAIGRKVGYPEVLMNDTFLNNLYKGITVTTQDALGNLLNIGNHEFKESMRKKGKQNYDKAWVKKLTRVNAFYKAQTNQIVLPSGMMRPPLFSHKSPNYLNYAGYGTTIGHEILHAFDDYGRRFDKNGLPTDWWTSQTSRKFLERTQCLIDQYDNFKYKVSSPSGHGYIINVNGAKTLGENIADNSGFKISYKTYKAWEEAQNKSEARLPGLNYTNDQVYFIQFAQRWCRVQTDQYLIKLIKGDDRHSPNDARVYGTIANSPHFGQIFKCANGTKMNPVKKCIVW